jgi:hypothetical protein
MDIIKALKREEAKLEKTARNATKRLATLRATMKLFGGGGMTGGGKTPKRRVSAASRAKMAKAQKARWAKVRAAKAKKAA